MRILIHKKSFRFVVNLVQISIYRNYILFNSSNLFTYFPTCLVPLPAIRIRITLFLHLTGTFQSGILPTVTVLTGPVPSCASQITQQLIIQPVVPRLNITSRK